VTLRHTSPDGDNGFPGTLAAAVTYAVDGPELRIELRAAIHEALRRTEGFRTAQQLHDELRGAGERVGLTTVYRELQALAGAGEVHAVDLNVHQNALLELKLAGLRNLKSSRYVMKEAIEEAGRGVAHQLERFLTTLGTIATASPLLGLFGTVIGMIEIFGSQTPTGTNPQQLAHGISIALYNTAFGIAIAIPALIFYRHYRNKVDTYVVEMEQQASKLVDMVHGERVDFAGERR
jgi:biopolymer transport protein ExbB